MEEQQAVLILGPGRRIPVVVTETDVGTLVVRRGNKVLFGLKPVTTGKAAEEPARPPAASTRALSRAARLNPRTSTWDWLTPAAVIEYFRQSSELKTLYDDVRDILGEDPVTFSTEEQLDLDLETARPHLDRIIQDGQLVYGHQTRIAEALGIPNQGSYRRRIQNVVRALAEEFGLKRAA